MARLLSPRVLACCTGIALVGCSGLTDMVNKAALPSGIIDPSTYNTPDGALLMYRRTIAEFEGAFVGALGVGGVLTDELHSGLVTEFSTQNSDFRYLGERQTDGVYSALQRVRTYAVQARGALAKYNPDAPAALRGEVYALEGYAELLLADLYCSGVPLSELEFEGDFVYKPGSTTQQLYQHAVTRFDSALALATGNDSVLNLARVGKGRALLALGERDSAAQAVALVSDGFRYAFPVQWKIDVSGAFLQPGSVVMSKLGNVTVADQEGGTGLPYRSNGDPRTAVVPVMLRPNPYSTTVLIYFPAKYGTPTGEPVYATATSPVILASGLEARLIEAEAQLQPAGSPRGPWLAMLNALRTNGTYTTTVRRDAQTGDSVGVDTTWNAGTGGVSGLAPLADPGSDTARVSLLFAERAYWLYLTGHRQGDLRRLTRQVSAGGYGRARERAYPSGLYVFTNGNTNGTMYGTDVTFPVPESERPNLLFKGCFNRNP